MIFSIRYLCCQNLKKYFTLEQTYGITKCFCSTHEGKKGSRITLLQKVLTPKEKTIIHHKVKSINSLFYGPILKADAKTVIKKRNRKYKANSLEAKSALLNEEISILGKNEKVRKKTNLFETYDKETKPNDTNSCATVEENTVPGANLCVNERITKPNSCATVEENTVPGANLCVNERITKPNFCAGVENTLPDANYSVKQNINLSIKEKSQPDSEVSNKENSMTDKQIFTDSSILLTNNSKYSGVPLQLNLNYIETFPLYKNEPMVHEDDNSLLENNKALGEIKTINMFEGGYKKLPSVSTILAETMPPESKKILENWENKMIAEMGEEEFLKYKQGLFHRGQIFHACIDETLRSGKSPRPEQLVGIEETWSSIKYVLPKLSNVQIIESRVVHPHLHYQGIIDCVATYRNLPVIIEFKTSTKPKISVQSTFDNPLQLVAYLGALNYDPSYDFLNNNIHGAVLVIAYPTGLPAHAHFLTKDKCEKYWNLWRQRVKKFWELNNANPLD